MTIFYLIRHGQKAHGNLSDALTPLGQRQAQQTAVYLQQQPVQRFYTSPIDRAKATAAIIAATIQLPAIEEPLLRERANWGDLPGQSFEEFIAIWERCNRERDWEPPLGDSACQAGARIERFIETHAQTVENELVIAVTHGGVIADFLLNVFPVATLAQVHPGFVAQPYSSAVIRECSITIVDYVAPTYHLVAIASVAHLE